MPVLREDNPGLLNTLKQHAASYRTVKKARLLAIHRALAAGIPINKISAASGMTYQRIWQLDYERKTGEPYDKR